MFIGFCTGVAAATYEYVLCCVGLRWKCIWYVTVSPLVLLVRNCISRVFSIGKEDSTIIITRSVTHFPIITRRFDAHLQPSSSAVYLTDVLKNSSCNFHIYDIIFLVIRKFRISNLEQFQSFSCMKLVEQNVSANVIHF